MRRPHSHNLSRAVERMHSKIAWETFETRVINLIENFSCPDIMELGGGRKPLFTPNKIPQIVNSYTINDISQHELDRLTPDYKRAQFDVCGNIDGHESQYDIIFSKMLVEHVPDGQQLHQNVHKMLKPGGIAFHFHPKLYAFPFVINKLLPEILSSRLLIFFFPERKTALPKFPARYSWCKGSIKSTKKRLKTIGFSHTTVEAFYGHGYYKNIPLLNNIEKATSFVCHRYNISMFAPYVFVTTEK